MDAVKIIGLAEFSRSLKKLDTGLPKALRLALNEAANVVINAAVPHVPVRTGRAAAALKARSTRTEARVTGGSARVPYYPWLDFGGRVGRNRSVVRPFNKQGRYLYKAYFEKKASGEFEKVLNRALLDVIRKAGMAVD